jgi:hypothetical protein
VAPLYQLSKHEVTTLETYSEKEVKSRIRPSRSPYGSPTFFVPKKDGQLRLVNYCRLNTVTVNNAYPLPLVIQIFDSLSTTARFTKLDLTSAYQLLRIAPGHEQLTAFRTPLGMDESLVATCLDADYGFTLTMLYCTQNPPRKLTD